MCNFRKNDIFCPRFGTYIWCQERDSNPRPPAYETRGDAYHFTVEFYLKLLKYNFNVVLITTKTIQKTTKQAKCMYLNPHSCIQAYYYITTLIAELLPSEYLAKLQNTIYLCVCLMEYNFTQNVIFSSESKQSLDTLISRFSTKLHGGVKWI